MKTAYEFAAITVGVFSLCFAISTLGYSIVDSSMPEIKIFRYGFPMTWLRATTVILPLAPAQYTILWFELCVDIVFYLALSLGISFITLNL
ncbi:MAG: hypothetical protein OEY24_01545 [Candidatus Bathyarchaeota archaeon]|nr:hypothetical protein [Candidatus Bathyarchaeota archaeon]MDH5494372.1 hypothetical protein [Candidatus Bathyarchaeota archaeon]